MVTHDARASAMADRILFLADGLIVRDQGRASEQDVLTAMAEVSGAVILVALRGLWGRKTRAVLTAISIVLGTAMIAGTFVVRDQITGAFASIFQTGLEKTDVLASKRTAFTDQNGAQAGPLPASLIGTIAARRRRRQGRGADPGGRRPGRERQVRRARAAARPAW